MNSLIIKIIRPVVRFFKYRNYPHITSTSRVEKGCHISNTLNLYMAEDTNINSGAIIMNTRAKLIMKKWSGAAVGLLAVTGNHMQLVGKSLKQITDADKDKLDINHELDKDIVVEEEVWIGSNVTLLAGVTLGRGSIIGASCVVRSGKVPPYAVLAGNPARVVAFRFTPEEIIEHEKALYPEEERLPQELLEKNYKKYFLDHIKEIKAYTGLICK